MAAARALYLVPDLEEVETIELPRGAVTRAAADTDSLADDLEAGLAAAEHRIFAGNRPAALNELYRLGLRVQQLREDYEPLGGSPATPTRPKRLA